MPSVLWIIGWNAITDKSAAVILPVAQTRKYTLLYDKHRIDTTQNSIFFNAEQG